MAIIYDNDEENAQHYVDMVKEDYVRNPPPPPPNSFSQTTPNAAQSKTVLGEPVIFVVVNVFFGVFLRLLVLCHAHCCDLIEPRDPPHDVSMIGLRGAHSNAIPAWTRWMEYQTSAGTRKYGTRTH